MKRLDTKSYDCAAGCPVEATLDLIDGKWKAVILYHLVGDTIRFNELGRRLSRITQRMLTRQLRELEAAGVFLVVAAVSVQYYLPAFFDDLLRLRTETVRAKGARVEHRYQVFRGDELLAEGTTSVACIDKQGRVTRLPQWLRMT